MPRRSSSGCQIGRWTFQEEIAKGNAEVARLSNLVVQAATSLQPVHTSMVAQSVPSAREFFWFSHGKHNDSVIGRSARSVANAHRGCRVGEASNPGPPKTLLRRRGPSAIPGMRNVVPRIEQTQTSTVWDSNEEPLLPHEHDRADVQSAASLVFAVRSPPPGATQLEDTNSWRGVGIRSSTEFWMMKQFLIMWIPRLWTISNVIWAFSPWWT